MNSRLMGEGILPHYGLVGGHGKGCQARYQPGELIYVLALDACIEIVKRLQGHHYLLQAGVSCPLADAVYCHMGLGCASPQRGHCIGCGHSEVVVAVDADRPAKPAEPGENIYRCLGNQNSHRIAEGQAIRPGLDSSLIEPDQIVLVRPAGILTGQLHHQSVVFGILCYRHRLVYHRLAVRFELAADVQIGYGNNQMYRIDIAA